MSEPRQYDTSDMEPLCQACFGTGYHRRAGPNVRCPNGCDVPSIFRKEDFDEKGRLKAYAAGPQPPDWISLRLCPPHASIKGTIRPIDTCPVCLRNHRDELINALIGIVAVTGWHLDADESFTEQGLVDLNRNLEVAHQLIGEANLSDTLKTRLRSTVTQSVLGLEKSYGSAIGALRAMHEEIGRRIVEEQ